MSNETRYDGATELSRISGIPRGEVLPLWEQVKANRAKLDACPRHRFDSRPVKMGQKVVCLECGGETGLVDIGYYLKGYRAAGGNPDDVWPGFFDGKSVG